MTWCDRIQSEDSIGTDPLPAGQVWAISPGAVDEHPGLYRDEMATKLSILCYSDAREALLKELAV
jgi:hypothetical protein